MKFIFGQSKVGRFLSTQALSLLDPDSGYTREGKGEGRKASHRPTENCPRLKCIRSPDGSFSCYHGKGDGLALVFLSGLGFHFYCPCTVSACLCLYVSLCLYFSSYSPSPTSSSFSPSSCPSPLQDEATWIHVR